MHSQGLATLRMRSEDTRNTQNALRILRRTTKNIELRILGEKYKKKKKKPSSTAGRNQNMLRKSSNLSEYTENAPGSLTSAPEGTDGDSECLWCTLRRSSTTTRSAPRAALCTWKTHRMRLLHSEYTRCVLLHTQNAFCYTQNTLRTRLLCAEYTQNELRNTRTGAHTLRTRFVHPECARYSETPTPMTHTR
jgi:hypothetical protein